MKRPNGILFDLGDTLLGEHRFNPVNGNSRLLNYADNTHGYTAEDVQKVADKIADELKQAREATMLEFRADCFQRLLYEKMGITLDQTNRDLQLEFWMASVEYTPEPGIYELLDYLADNRIKMGVLSNSAFDGQILRWELEKHNLLKYFSFVLSSADYGVRKPHHLFFSIGIKKMCLDLEAMWYVGDKIEYDILGANRSGLFSVWYNKKGGANGKIKPDIEISSWSEILSILKRLPVVD